MMERDRERITREQSEQKEREATLTAEKVDLKRSVDQLQQERTERENTLRDKEAKIAAYKVKVNTLKKFKHVLDFRLREVTASLQPKDQLLTQMNVQLKELEGEFERQLTEQRTMESQLDTKDQKIQHLTAETNKLRNVVKQREQKIEKFNTDLYSLVNNQTDIRQWPSEIRKMYHEHVQGEKSAGGGEDKLPIEELQRQMRLMERKVTTLAVKGGRTEAACKSDIQRKAHENSLLIHELNELRVE